MAKKRTVTRYRDKDTGRFVSKKTWQRSRTQGGQRFVRSRIVKRAKRRLEPIVRKKRLRPRALPRPEEAIIGELVPDGYVLVDEETSRHKTVELAFKKLMKMRRVAPDPAFFIRIASRKGAVYVFETYLSVQEEEIEYEGAFDSP